jgi:RNA polymerase sigma factor (sigma-70 family)
MKKRSTCMKVNKRVTKASAIDLTRTTEGRAKPARGITAGGSTQRRRAAGDYESVPALLTNLARQAAAGDAGALDTLLGHKEFQRRLDGICRWLCWRYPHKVAYCDSQDLRQEVALGVLRKITQFRGESSVLTFVRHMARNIHISQLRRENVESGHAAALHQPRRMEPPSEVELRALLSVEVSRLGEAQRRVLIRWVEGATLKEIARELSCSVSTARSALEKVQQQLVKSVEDEKRKKRLKPQVRLSRPKSG